MEVLSLYIKNIGKRKIRYYKNGNPYVIIKGKKKIINNIFIYIINEKK